MSDNKCAGCGQFAGRGHKCPTPTLSSHAPAAPTPRQHGLQADEPNIDDRVHRAQAALAARTTRSGIPHFVVDPDPETPSVKVPAGRYWITDPCYAIEDDHWHEWLESADFMNNRNMLYAETASGYPVFAFSTKYGDGLYTDGEGAQYAVDAGLIGLVPYDACRDKADELSRLGHVVEFGRETSCYADDGTLRFGHVVIETGDTDTDEEDECDYCGMPEFECSCEEDED